MPEKNPQNHDWEVLKARLESFRLKARIKVGQTVDEIKYQAATTPGDRERASLFSEAFAGEVMHFMGDNLHSKLSPLDTTTEQEMLFQFLLDSIEDEELVLQKTSGRVDITGIPYTIKHYKSGNGEDNLINSVTDTSFLHSPTKVNLVTRWGIQEPFPHGFTVFGNMGDSKPTSMDFITLPEKPETVDDVKKTFGYTEKTTGNKYKVGLYNKGERIVINREETAKNEIFSLTSQYYLVGAFDGEATERTFWLYGSNPDKHHKMTVTNSIGVQDTVSQRNI